MILGLLIITLSSRNKKIQVQNSQIKMTNLDLSNNIEEKEFLLQEVNHRVKNNLAFIQSLVAFQREEAVEQETADNLENLNSRIHAIAVLHDQFVSAKNNISKHEILIAPYLTTIADAQIIIKENTVKFDQKVGDIKVDLETAVPIGILVNELITNSLKHAEVVDDILYIELKLYKINDELQLSYRDNGIKFNSSPATESLGMYIIKTMVRQLRGTIDRQGSQYFITIKKRL